jgi:DNA-binding transcriptional LysR family regulator
VNLAINGGLKSAKALGGQLSASNGDALREVTINVLGIATLPTFIIKDALNDGRLKRVLGNDTLSSVPNHIIRLSR